MKTLRLLGIAAVLVLSLASAQAGFFDDIKGKLTGPEVKEAPKYVAFYFSAHWCPPCRAFTPKLIEWYKEFKPKHPNFELVFVSADQDEAAMKEYMTSTGMPWPAVKYDQREDKAFTDLGSDGIPYLVLVDASTGKALTAKPGNEWQPPQEILGKIEEMVK